MALLHIKSYFRSQLHRYYRKQRNCNRCKGSRGKSKMHTFIVKCLQAQRSVTVRAENHKDAARKSGLAVPGVILTVEGPEEKNVWKRYQVDQANRLREVASYIA